MALITSPLGPRQFLTLMAFITIPLGQHHSYPFMVFITFNMGPRWFLPLHGPHYLPPGLTLFLPLHGLHYITPGLTPVHTPSWPAGATPQAHQLSGLQPLDNIHITSVRHERPGPAWSTANHHGTHTARSAWSGAPCNTLKASCKQSVKICCKNVVCGTYMLWYIWYVISLGEFSVMKITALLLGFVWYVTVLSL